MLITHPLHIAVIAKERSSLLEEEILFRGCQILTWQELGASVEDSKILGELGIPFFGTCEHLVWAQDVFFDVKIFEIESISKAQMHLRSLKSPLVCWETHFHRRAELIAQGVPKPKDLNLRGFEDRLIEFGVWAMINAKLGFCTLKSREKWPFGSYQFLETKLPPSRAYLKLWEIFYRIGRWPSPSESVVELGASPGGWTWVFIQQLKCEVRAMDRAPLRDDLMKSPRLQFSKMDAFSFLPDPANKVDWIFSDLICEPHRLLDYVKNWAESGLVMNIVATIKFKGDTDTETMSEFGKIPGSQIIHLYNNKHEVTWIFQRPV